MRLGIHFILSVALAHSSVIQQLFTVTAVKWKSVTKLRQVWEKVFVGTLESKEGVFAYLLTMVPRLRS